LPFLRPTKLADYQPRSGFGAMTGAAAGGAAAGAITGAGADSTCGSTTGSGAGAGAGASLVVVHPTMPIAMIAAMEAKIILEKMFI